MKLMPSRQDPQVREGFAIRIAEKKRAEAWSKIYKNFTGANTGQAQFIQTNGATSGKAYYQVRMP